MDLDLRIRVFIEPNHIVPLRWSTINILLFIKREETLCLNSGKTSRSEFLRRPLAHSVDVMTA